ncbi:MAG: 30S ribosomal protein S7 [Nanoarchaeota archaeon]|nr:30S ribosomal protein S7 [Nanoarchaeota archaeon]
MTTSLLLFNRWDTTQVAVTDPGLKNYINLSPKIIPRTNGLFTSRPVSKVKATIVERFVNKLMVPGHRGKKHKITSGRCTASNQAILLAVREAFDLIEKRTKKNPVQVLVQAIENAALYEEIAAYRLGGIIARQAVVVSPYRRLDLALRHITQGIYGASFRSKKSLAAAIADELIAGAANDAQRSVGVRERQRLEKEAEGAR